MKEKGHKENPDLKKTTKQKNKQKVVKEQQRTVSQPNLRPENDEGVVA